jgi:hypothetical protein
MAHDEWPAPLAENPSQPRDIGPPWSEHVQGVANARGQWFISQADRLWRFPMDLYSSTFDTDRLCVYRRSLDVDESGRVTGLELEHVRDVPLRGEGGEPLSLQRVQGGAFSPRNHLYLACDTRNGGLRGFDVTTGRCQMHVEIRFESGWPEQEVIEGLTVLDLDDGRVPRMSGQVHVLVFDAEHQRDDYVWLRHFAARTATDRYRV